MFRRATPLPFEFMQAVVAAACMVREWSFAEAIPIGFLGVLRTLEIFHPRDFANQISPGSGCSAWLSVSKTAQRSGVITDPCTDQLFSTFDCTVRGTVARFSNSFPTS